MVLSSRRLPSLLRVPASPVPRSPRYYEGATTSHPRCPRSLICFASAAHASLPGSCLAVALLKRRRVRSRPGPLVVPAALFRLARAWTRVGSLRSSGDPSRAFGSVPRPRSNRNDLASRGHLDAAPTTHTVKASAMADFGANPQLRHTQPYASCATLPQTCKACFRLAGWPLPGGSRTL
jgi:hypothetical protein